MIGQGTHRMLVVALTFVVGVALGALYPPLRDFMNRQLDNLQTFVAEFKLANNGGDAALIEPAGEDRILAEAM